MMKNTFKQKLSIFPWVFFFKLLRFHSLVLISSLLCLFYVNRIIVRNFLSVQAEQIAANTYLGEELLQKYDLNIFLFLLPVFVIFYFLIFAVALYFSKTLKILLAQVTHLESRLPDSIRLKVIYNDQDLEQIENAITLPEKKIEDQLNIIKKEDRKNKTLLESITDGIFAIDIHERSLFYNSKFVKKFISFKEFEQRNLTLSNIFSAPEIIEAYRKCLSQKDIIIVKEFHLKHQNRDIFFDIKITPIKDDQNTEILGVVGVFHDVTERKLTEQMRVDFVANVSHEIRTPLTSIIGYSQILQSQSQTIPENLRDFVEKIISNGERLQRLFSDLLNLSVIESQNKLAKESTDLKELIESVHDSLLSIYTAKKIKIDYLLNSPQAYIDPKLFEQVITNLLDNACKYNDEDEILIKISSDDENDLTVLTFSDNGPGISQEHLNRIFERFYRVDHSRTKEHSGAGLGLSIVKHIINKHKGNIFVENNLEGVTTFIIKIPRKVLA
jgi:two-component system phosphate regulon sensor histidine kinase PhoR